MKLLVVTCVKELQEDITKIFRQAHIHVFSTAPITGFRDDQQADIMDKWFASSEEKMDSLLLFSFTSAENAELGMSLIQKYNTDMETIFPVRSFIVPVEKSGM